MYSSNPKIASPTKAGTRPPYSTAKRTQRRPGRPPSAGTKRTQRHLPSGRQQQENTLGSPVPGNRRPPQTNPSRQPGPGICAHPCSSAAKSAFLTRFRTQDVARAHGSPRRDSSRRLSSITVSCPGRRPRHSPRHPACALPETLCEPVRNPGQIPFPCLRRHPRANETNPTPSLSKSGMRCPLLYRASPYARSKATKMKPDQRSLPCHAPPIRSRHSTPSGGIVDRSRLRQQAGLFSFKWFPSGLPRVKGHL